MRIGKLSPSFHFDPIQGIIIDYKFYCPSLPGFRKMSINLRYKNKHFTLSLGFADNTGTKQNLCLHVNINILLDLQSGQSQLEH